jgi:hypothetical protein
VCRVTTWSSSPAGAEDLVVQGEIADDRVVVQPGAVGVVQDVVVGPPAAEVVVAQ